MGCHRVWLIWLSLTVGAFLALPTECPAQEPKTQRRAVSRLPLDELAEPWRERVRQVVEQPTLFGHGPSEAFGGDPDLYNWLLDNPERCVLAWRRLGAKCTEIKNRGQGVYGWSDAKGSDIHWQVVHDGDSQRIWFAEGKVRPSLFLPPVPVQLVISLRHGHRPDGPDRTVVFQQADVFLKTDGKTGEFLSRMVGPSVPRLAEQYLGQLETFYSGLVWYIDHHPERTTALLAPEATAPAK